MKRSDIIRRAGQNLRQAKLRTFLTALAISVGAFTITLAMAAGTGAKDYTDTLISSNGDMKSLSVFPKMEDEASSDEPQKYDIEEPTTAQGLMSEHDVEKIKNIDGVESVFPMFSIVATYMTGQSNEKYQTTINTKVDRTSLDLAAGSLDNNQPKLGSVVIPDSYVDSLGFASAKDAIGKSITLRIDKQLGFGLPPEGKDMSFTIEAVSKESDMVMSYGNVIWINADDAKAIYNYQSPDDAADSYYGMTVQVSDKADIESVRNAVEEKGYTVFSMQDLQKALFTFVNVVTYGVAAFGALAILASIFGIINTQYISVLERTQQIGLMKALGARRKDIGKLFRYEAAWVGFLGGAIGTVGALLVGFLNPWITTKLGLEEGTNLLVYKPLFSVGLIVGLMVVAVLAGYFPSRKAAKLDPIEALRTE